MIIIGAANGRPFLFRWMIDSANVGADGNRPAFAIGPFFRMMK
jgi:hypothetical protein